MTTLPDIKTVNDMSPHQQPSNRSRKTAGEKTSGRYKAKRFPIRGRTVILSLVGVILIGWFVLLLIRAKGTDAFDSPLTLAVVCLVMLWYLLFAYCTRFSRCPNCGMYQFGEEGGFLANRLKSILSLAGDQGSWQVCRNCQYREWLEGTDSCS